ncbi:restriction endonuclease subunit S [Burkholderia cepacia]|uniref:restriction endonuclease subunit S n=1 Tax=Burkholderia cepacia TaxID=292 RepID=UPI001C9805E7|nr:restriction endonuclease subunit S [Burkholderia cepacia]MBY4804471.1 restriction endonuclease subunit S [Burkholderia cepacia]
MSLPRYPQYKDSGIAWLGHVPSHWQVRRLGFYFEERREKVSDKDYPALSVTKAGVVPQLETAAKTDDGDNRKKVCTGDFVINSRSDRKGSAGASCLEGSVSLINTVLRPTGHVDIGFAHYLLRSVPFQEEFYRYGKGIVADLWSTNYSEMRNILLTLPNSDEQASIVAFLDRETGKIDALVAEQEKLLALLAEKRQATISHAVTRGLNPDVPMKDSGVAWLGEVPAHWCIGALGYLCSIETGATPDRGNPSYWNGSIPWLKTGEINWTPISKAEEFISEDGLANSAAKLAKPGTLLMAMYGQGVTRGRVALLEIEAAYNQACAAMSFGPRVLPGFARFFFMAAYDYVRDGGNETSQMNLSAGLIAKFKLSIPPVDEQTDIVSWLDSEVSKLDSLNTEAERAINLLKERRSALITAAVTGKIDVRNTVLPQELVA